MKSYKFVLALVVTAVLATFLLTLGHAQNIPQTQVEVPQDQIVAESKPFLGTWNAVSCQPEGAYGLQFKIEQGKGEDIRPQLTLVQTFSPGNPVQTVNYPFQTEALLKFTSTEKPVTLLDVTNGVVFLTLVPQKNGTLFGDAQIEALDQEFAVLLAPANYSLDVFFNNVVGACTDETKQKQFFGEENGN